MSPTDCCDETRRLRIARRLGSAITSNTDSTLLVYFEKYMLVKAYKKVAVRIGIDEGRKRAGGVGGKEKSQPRFRRLRVQPRLAAEAGETSLVVSAAGG